MIEDIEIAIKKDIDDLSENEKRSTDFSKNYFLFFAKNA